MAMKLRNDELITYTPSIFSSILKEREIRKKNSAEISIITHENSRTLEELYIKSK